MEMDNNPFKAPTARVADAHEADGEFVPEGQTVEAGRGTAWLGHGWEMFKAAPGPWIGITVVYFVIAIVLGLIPILGGLAVNLLIPVFIGGIMLGCRALDQGEELTVGHLFAGFSNNFGNLVLVGLIYLVGFVAIMIIAFVIGTVVGIGAAMTGAGKMAILPVLLVALIAMLAILPLAMALWFAPALVLFHGLAPFDAMKASFFACLKNFMPFLVYGIVVVILAILATLPILLGWLVLTPVLFASMYAGYRDMFLRRA